MRWMMGLALGIAGTLAAAPPPPHLVVVISVDQFSEELLTRWGADLPGGLGRLWREGTVFQDAYQDHGYTETGPGHSVILTGCHPMHTGITENAWPSPEGGRPTYCVEDPRGRLLGEARGTAVGPGNLNVSTLGEWLTAQVKGSRSFAVTGKDRSAILMAGHRAQGVYWFAGGAGFTSSAAYASTLPAWLETYNAAFLTGVRDGSLFWSPLDAGAVPAPAAYTVRGATVTLGLPRLIHAVGMPLDAPFWGRFRASPFFDQAILGAAEALRKAEGLGKGPSVDLLALGLSATDYVGHGFGNGGPEMCDQVRRLDRELGTWLDRLQREVPGLWVVLTADHGAADFPERLQAQGIRASRIPMPAWEKAFNREVSRRLGEDATFFRPSNGQQLHLDEAALKGSRHSRHEVLEAALAAAKADPEVQEACSAEEMEALVPDPAEAPDRRGIRARLRLSYVKGRSGDLLLAFRPFHVPDDPTELAEHGFPYDYDRRVPLIFWGPWKAEKRTEPVRIIDLAPTLAEALGIKPANPVDGRSLSLAECGKP